MRLKNRIHGFDNVETRIWLCGNAHLITNRHALGQSEYGRNESVPYAWRNVRNQFRGGRGELRSVSLAISWVLREHSPNIRNVFAICLIYIRKMFATRWLSVCYTLTEEKGDFQRVKVWFLHYKSMVFGVQKGGS